MEYRECLRHFSLFSDLPDELFEQLLSIVTYKTLPASSILLYENDEVDNIYFLCSGLFKVYKVDRFEHEIFLYHLMPGTIISELTDFSEAPIRCFSNIEALEESVILVMDKKKLLSICEKTPLIYQYLLAAFSEKSRLMQCLINRELVYDGTAKVAYTLLFEKDLFGKMKKQEIAYMLNMQPETLSRILKKFVRKGVIELESNNVKILDRASLEEVCT